jgi:hypothetical protein
VPKKLSIKKPESNKNSIKRKTESEINYNEKDKSSSLSTIKIVSLENCNKKNSKGKVELQ